MFPIADFVIDDRLTTLTDLIRDFFAPEFNDEYETALHL